VLGVVSKTIVNATWGGSPKGVWFHGVFHGVLLVALSCDCAEPPGSLTAQSAAIHALRAFKGLVGRWRGVGQPKRTSAQGAWQENAAVIWELKPQSAGIRWDFEAGKLWKSAVLSYADTAQLYTLKTTLLDDSTRTYQGTLDQKRLVLESAPEVLTTDIHRLTMTFLSENRLTMLFEKRPEQQSFYTRVAEIGYQRDGTRLAAIGSGGPVCLITGGAGTLPVVYQGKTYYVCCTGCRDAFHDDPTGTLAEYEKTKFKQATAP
jgi:YHS domain-containing protein